MSREQQLAEALVGLADSFADDIDPVVLVDRLAQHCVEISGADAVGIMAVTARGDLRTLAVTDDQAGFLELFELQTDEGPCLDCFREGHRVDARDLAADTDRWPQVVPFALHSGFRAAHALPLRVHGQTVGAVNLLLREPGGLAPLELDLAQALADVSAVALVNWTPDPLRPTDVASSVQAALAGRAAVSMATGMIAETAGLPLAEAHGLLRAYSRDRHQRLVDTAHALIRRALTPDAVLAARS
ncbi:GAF and ANTAR domain-containing protein [Streptomyces sp. NPDC047869]|uniref:GAF and ANTAR domain-containing protein n=1 Tax=Streptomyces sp. NPDC047869 TaxID=3154709 RepID=UPI0034515BE4